MLGMVLISIDIFLKAVIKWDLFLFFLLIKHSHITSTRGPYHVNYERHFRFISITSIIQLKISRVIDSFLSFLTMNSNIRNNQGGKSAHDIFYLFSHMILCVFCCLIFVIRIAKHHYTTGVYTEATGNKHEVFLWHLVKQLHFNMVKYTDHGDPHNTLLKQFL